MSGAIELLTDAKMERLLELVDPPSIASLGSAANGSGVNLSASHNAAEAARQRSGLGGEEQQEGQALEGLLFFAQVNLVMALVASLPCVLAAPEASSSGIPEVMSYLNGVHVPGFLRLRTLAAKVWGTCWIVASGLAVGPEGPLVHCGAIVGSGLTRGTGQARRAMGCSKARASSASSSHPRSTPAAGVRPAATAADSGGGSRCLGGLDEFTTLFHNDTDRRDFISMGAAAGFAAAFGAPIGGVLFSLEEASSFFSTKLMWRTLTCTSLACFSLSVLRGFGNQQVERRPGGANYRFEPGLLTLNTNADAKGFSYQAELLLCAFEGCLGGALGALFNTLHAKCAALRPRAAPSGAEPAVVWRQRAKLCLEVCAVSLLSSTLMFGVAWLGSDRGLGFACQPDDKLDKLSVSYKYETLTFFCEPEAAAPHVRRYNDMATIFLTSRENSVLSIVEHPHNFSRTSLLTLTLCFFVLMLLGFGSGAYPAGLFMPTVVVGCTFGGLYGRLVKDGACLLACPFREGPCFGNEAGLQSCFAANESSPIQRSGPYALLGAVALLGGVQRASLSLVVIIVEGTGKVDYLLPIIVTVVCAKWVGDRLSPHGGLYHLGLSLKGIPFLDSECPRWMMSTRADDIMMRGARPAEQGGKASSVTADTAGVMVCQRYERVRNVVRLLRSCSHNGFPVVGYQARSEREQAWETQWEPASGSPRDADWGAGAEPAARSYNGQQRRQPGNGAGALEGLVLRQQLVTLLRRKRFWRGVPPLAAHTSAAAAVDPSGHGPAARPPD